MYNGENVMADSKNKTMEAEGMKLQELGGMGVQLYITSESDC